jgi:hypothetical protein
LERLAGSNLISPLETGSERYGNASTFRRFRLRINLHGSRHAGQQQNAIRHLIDVNAYLHTLRKAHPGEDRIYQGEPRGVRLSVRDLDATAMPSTWPRTVRRIIPVSRASLKRFTARGAKANITNLRIAPPIPLDTGRLPA